MKVGFIGTGAIVARHVRALRSLPLAVEVTCHVGTSAGKAEAAAREWGGAGFTDLEACLSTCRPDAMIVTVPPDSHGAIERCLVAAGVPFLVEKPLSADRQTAEDIGALLAGRDLVVAVGYQWRALDTLGAVRAVMARRPVRLVSARYFGGTPGKAWWTRQARSGGQIVEQACHVIDLARHLTGGAQVLAALPAHASRPALPEADIAVATAAVLRFGADTPGIVETTCLTPHLQDAHVTLVGEGWSATIRMAGTVLEVDGETTTLAPSRDPYAVQAETFLAAVAQRRPDAVLCTYEDALATHRTCHDIVDWPRHAKA